MKYFYKGLGLFIIFGISLFIFGQDIPSINVGTATATILQDSTFPLISLKTGGYTVNTLHGYSSELNSANVRESITPLNATKTFQVLIAENELDIKRLDYELQDIANQKIIGSGSYSAFSQENGRKTIEIKIDAGMDTSTEYGMRITLTTNYSKKIHFFTRIKYYDSDFFLSQKLDFAQSFHDATFGQKNGLDIKDYLETDGDSDSTYANVNIHSSKKMVTWGKLNPKILTECIPTIKEINIETAAIEMDYFVRAKTNSGNETFHIKEFYRIRYSSNRIYLLYFQRTMEAFFNPKLTSKSQSEFKIGISNIEELNAISNADKTKMTFVNNGNLWYYDLKTERLNQVFSFIQDSKDYMRDYYDQHDIRILNIDKDGNIDFVVYGYMNCGDYEGRVGILLYSYAPEDDQITERIYIPLDTTYQRLKEDFGSFCYVNKKDIFYFSLYDRVYSYNITSKQYEVLTKNASSSNFAMLEDTKCFVWSNATQKKGATELTVLNLDTEKKFTISAKPGQNIRVLGTIDSTIVYGYVRKKDVYKSTDGESISPVYKVVIADSQGKILKEYQNKNVYITQTIVENDIIHLKRIKKVNGVFKRISEDSIQHQKTSSTKSITLTSRVTDRTLVEKYISLPAGFMMKGLPETTSTKYVMITENTTFHINNPAKNVSDKYYIYAYGEITGVTANAGDAILQADEQMGVVMDNSNRIIWERGGKFNSKTINLIDKTISSGNVNSVKACAQMLLQAAQVTVSTSDLKGYSAMDMLKGHLDTPVNLTGCTLDEVLYFVSKGKPVIAMRSDTQAVLINAYTLTNVEWFDPATGSSKKMSINGAEKLLKEAGYVFVSYI